MQASGSQKWEKACMADCGQALSGSEAEEGRRESPEEETHAIMDNSLFQPIQRDTRQKYETVFGDSCCASVTDSELIFFFFILYSYFSLIFFLPLYRFLKLFMQITIFVSFILCIQIGQYTYSVIASDELPSSFTSFLV